MMLPKSTREKSVMLAKAMGLKWEELPRYTKGDAYLLELRRYVLKSRDGHKWSEVHIADEGELSGYEWGSPEPDLYDPANMAQAWRVHIWATGVHIVGVGYIDWWYEELPWYESDAQAAWLDKILTLAIEAGLVEV